MYPYFETIKVLDGEAFHLKYHQQRLNNTLLMADKVNLLPSFREIFKTLQLPAKGLYKCRIEYNNSEFSVTLDPYEPKHVETLKVIEDNNIEYPFKYTDRSLLQELLALKGNCDDILIIRNGHVTDTSYTNIAFYDGHDWLTPDTYLLPGTARTRLLETGVLKSAPIHKEDILRFKCFKLINSMLNTDFTDYRKIEGIVI